MGKSRLISYFTLLMFICTWITVNLTFPAISLAMSADHHFRFENRNGNSHIVFFHPENEEQEHLQGTNHQHEHQISGVAGKKHQHHEHSFQLVSSDDNMIVPVNPSLYVDSDRAPPLTLISKTFNLVPQGHSPYKYYKYPSGVNTTSLSLKTIVLLI